MASAFLPDAIFADARRHRRLMASVASAQPALDAFRSERERQSRILESFTKSPALEAFAAQTKANDKLLKSIADSGVMGAFDGHTDTILKTIADSGVLGAFDGHNDTVLKAVRDSGVMGAFGGQNDTVLKAIADSGVLGAFGGQNGKWLEQVRSTFDNSAVLASFGAQQKERHRELLAAVGGSPAIELAFRTWQVTMPPGMAERMAEFQGRVLAEAAVGSPPLADKETLAEPWFGEESWSKLVFHMVAVLKCAEMITAGMTGAKMGLNAPIPSGVLYLLAIVLAAGELAAHFAEPAAGRKDELSEDDRP